MRLANSFLNSVCYLGRAIALLLLLGWLGLAATGRPGFAWLGEDKLTTGNEAFTHSRIDPRRIQHRFWSELTTTPFADNRFSHLSAADLASTQLEQVRRAVGGEVSELVVAVPAYMTGQNLGLFLGIAGELEFPVVAMADAAVAATRR